MKKVLALALSLALIATLAISGTIAYLTDTDEAVNVMTLGNVDIEQIEQEFNTDNKLVDFTQGKPLYPVVGELGWENEKENGGAYRKFTMENVVDKYVSVENTGKSDAYVRTIIAFEQGTESPEVINNYMGISVNAADGNEFKFEGAWIWDAIGTVEIDGNYYDIMVATHEAPVPAGETTIPSLLQVYLKETADNEQVEQLDGNDNGLYDILVVSQAVQTQGFGDAKTALDTAFGKADATNVADWLGGMDVPETVSTSAELSEALAAGKSVYLTEDITATTDTLASIPKGVSATLNLNGHNITATLTGNAHTQMFEVKEGASLTINGEGNVHAVANKTTSYVSVIINNLGGDVVVNGGTYTMEYGSYDDGYLLPSIIDTNNNVAPATTTINGGTFYHTRNMFRNFAQNRVNAPAKLVINGGSFNGIESDFASIWNQKTSAGNVEGSGIVEINGGTYTYVNIDNEYETGVTIADGIVLPEAE